MIDKIKRVFSSRYLYVIVFTFICLAFIIGRLFYLQIINGEKIEAASSMGQKGTRIIEAPRGNIYDRNGVLIATNRTAYIVQMVYTRVPQADKDKMYINLINLFNKNGDSYINSLEQYLKSPTEWGESLLGNDDKIKDWLNYIGARKLVREGNYSPSDAFQYLRNDKYKINLELSDEEAYKICIIRYEITKNGSSFVNPIRISNEVSAVTMAEIEARNLDFPGISTEETYFRQYINPVPVAHLLGYVRSINQDEYEKLKDQGYRKDDIIGKVGIEKGAETYLRGIPGEKTIYIDNNNRQLKELSYKPAVPGNDIYLTIDLRLQNVALNALKNTLAKIRSQRDNKVNFGDAFSGSVVVSNAKNGEILAMVSFPDYDPNLFLQPASDKDAQQKITDLFKDPTSPSLNRVTQGLYPPGSTFKMITAIAALETGNLTENDTVHCSGSVTYENNQSIKCLGVHGSINLEQATAVSCNVFFCEVGVRTTISQIEKWAQAFGLGEKTGIEITEYKGIRNSIETMKLKDKDKTHIWSKADTAQSAIGQLYNQFTPLQMNIYYSTIANGGYKQVPHLINKAITKDGKVVFDNKPEATKLDIKPETISSVKKGLLAVVNYGSSFAGDAFRNFGKEIKIAGKTGTPQTGEEIFGKSSHANFVCYAPADDPEIVITVNLEHGVWGGNGSYVAAEILKEYLKNENDKGIPNMSIPDGSQFIFER